MLELEHYLPKTSYSYVEHLLKTNPIRIRISKGRLTKYGDYRAAVRNKPEQISINADLNSFAFLITLIHELAHAKTFREYKNKVKPHGKEWKSDFIELMTPLLSNAVFPQEILIPLKAHLRNPKASTSADIHLLRALKNYNQEKDSKLLEQIDEGTYFQLVNGKQFLKGPKKRKNFLCLEINSKRKYMVSPLAEVKIIGAKNSTL